MSSIKAYQEQIFFFYILENRNLLEVTKPTFFSNSNLRELFKLSKEHVLKYKEVPTIEQLNELVKISGLSEKITPEILKALYNVKVETSNYSEEWLEQNVKPWIGVKNLEEAYKMGIGYLKTTNITADNAQEVLENARNLFINQTAIDFEFKMGSDFWDPKSHLQTRLARHSTGYDFMDICMKGGFWAGSLIALIGPPKGGKSLWLNNLAARSVQLGQNTAYITLELQEEIVNMRIGSNILSININEYEKVVEDQDRFSKIMSSHKQRQLIQPGFLYVKEFPSSTASSTDIREHLKKVQELLGIKFKNVFVDYINIMRNWRNPNTENTYMKIKQIAEDLRAMAMEEQWTVITVSQTKRDAMDTNDLTLASISESVALIHTVDMLFGIITNPEMKAGNEYYLKCLANRVNGMENVRKRFTVNWDFARIEEDMDAKIEDMDQILSAVNNMNMNRLRSNIQQPESDVSINVENNVNSLFDS